MLVTDVVAAIENTANPALAAAWDKSGLQVASTRTEVFRMAVMLDATPRSIKAALAAGADFLLAHHPLALEPRLPDRLDAWRECLALLLAANLPLYAAHTSLDVNIPGPAGWLARALDLRNLQVLEHVGTEPLRGYGACGDLPESEPAATCIDRIMELAGIREAQLCGPAPARRIERIAFCGGSGGSLMQLAAGLGANLYITGDIKYHTALDTPLPVLDVGHHSLEEKMMRHFALLLGEELPKMEIIFVPTSSPFRTIAGKREMTNE